MTTNTKGHPMKTIEETAKEVTHEWHKLSWMTRFNHNGEPPSFEQLAKAGIIAGLRMAAEHMDTAMNSAMHKLHILNLIPTPAESAPAKHEPTPAPAFGGPHDEQAVKWAEANGEKVIGYGSVVNGDRYIANGHQSEQEYWFANEVAHHAMRQTMYYILAPLAQPEPEQGKVIDRQKINDICDSLGRTMADHFKQLLAELRKEGEGK